jgi:hypothetical protein
VTGGTAPYTYKWSLASGDSSTSASPTQEYDTATNSTYPVKLTVTDFVENTAGYDYVVKVNRSTPVCLFNYSMSKPKADTSVTTNANEFSDITIIYTNSVGTVYTSKNIAQPGTSNFQVLSVSSYENNINNEAVKMLKVTFNCLLYPASGPPIEATNCTAVIAVAYK